MLQMPVVAILAVSARFAAHKWYAAVSVDWLMHLAPRSLVRNNRRAASDNIKISPLLATHSPFGKTDARALMPALSARSTSGMFFCFRVPHRYAQILRTELVHPYD